MASIYKTNKKRKKTPGDLLLTQRLHINLSSLEYQSLKTLCKTKNCSLSSFVRKLIIDVAQV